MVLAVDLQKGLPLATRFAPKRRRRPAGKRRVKESFSWRTFLVGEKWFLRHKKAPLGRSHAPPIVAKTCTYVAGEILLSSQLARRNTKLLLKRPRKIIRTTEPHFKTNFRHVQIGRFQQFFCLFESQRSDEISGRSSGEGLEFAEKIAAAHVHGLAQLGWGGRFLQNMNRRREVRRRFDIQAKNVR